MKRIALIVLMLVVFSTVTSAVPCTIDSDPSQKTANVGDVFTVVLIVTITGEADTVAVDLITWNDNVLECTNIVRGDLFPDSLIWLPGTIGTGQIAGTVTASNIPISNKNGTYSIITFKVKGSGDTTITLHDFGIARAGEPLDTSILGGCHVVVSGSTPPSNPPSNPPEIPPVIPPPVQPPQNDTGNNTGNNTSNNTIPPVIPPVIPPILPPVTQNDTNSSNYQPTDKNIIKDEDSLPFYILVSALLLLLITLIVVIVVLKIRDKKQKEKEKDIFDEGVIHGTLENEKKEIEDSDGAKDN